MLSVIRVTSSISHQYQALLEPNAHKFERSNTTLSESRKEKVQKCKESYVVYKHKMLKQINSDTGISRKAMPIMISIVTDIFERFALLSSFITMLKQINPDTGISSKAIPIMNSIVTDIFERFALLSSFITVRKSTKSAILCNKGSKDFRIQTVKAVKTAFKDCL
ncbi:hypothetical protein GJ496_005221 [Pomphorhynchus laevis]|nr:hypothetical protein GJ496_005221 [Pomphorhynchus laevis]